MNGYDYLDESVEINVSDINDKFKDLLLNCEIFDEDCFNYSTFKFLSIKESRLILTDTDFDGGAEISSNILVADNFKGTLLGGSYIAMGYLYEKVNVDEPAYVVLEFRDGDDNTYVLIEIL